MKRPVPHIVHQQTRPLEHIVVKAWVVKPAQWASDSQFRVNDTTSGDDNGIFSGTKERTSGLSLDVPSELKSLTQGPLSLLFMFYDPDPVRSRTTQGVFVFSRPPETQLLMFNFKPVKLFRENRVCLFVWTGGWKNKSTTSIILFFFFFFNKNISNSNKSPKTLLV